MKKVFFAFLLFSFLSFQSNYGVENKFFSLSQKANECIKKLSVDTFYKRYYCQILESYIKKPLLVIRDCKIFLNKRLRALGKALNQVDDLLLPIEIYEIIDQNIDWKLAEMVQVNIGISSRYEYANVAQSAAVEACQIFYDSLKENISVSSY